jgi:DNA polymerase-3 subunit delta
MPLRPDQLAGQLSRRLASAYLLAGEEPLLVEEAADAVRAQARAEGYAEREVLHVEAGFDWGRLRRAGENLSLFSNRRLIELHLPEKGPGVEGAQALSEFLEAAPPDTLLLVRAGRLDKKQRGSGWVTGFERAGVVMYAWPVGPAELPGWITARARAAGLQPDPESVDMLASRTEGNLLACAQELDKLKLIYPDGRLDAARVQAAVADSTRFGVMDLANRALAGDAAGALQTLRRLEGEGEAAVLIVWTLARDLRVLH